MQRMRLLTAASVLLVFATSSMAIEPSHYGKKYGNPEEPATRPYKAFWRGLKAFKFQLKTTMQQGHDKAGYVGEDVQFFRGVRRGVVEIGAGTYMGMAGSYPIPVEKTHPANEFLDSDRRLAALADLPTTAGLLWVGGAGSVGTVFGPGYITIAQSEVDRHAMTPEERAQVAAQAAKTAQQHWPADAQSRNAPRPAGLKYQGEWKIADDKAKAEGKTSVETPYSGDMIKKARKGHIVENK